MKENIKGKTYYKRGTEELRKKTIRAHKLIYELDNLDG